MLDQIRSSLQTRRGMAAELAEIEGELAELTVRREGMRCTLGEAVQLQTHGSPKIDQAKARAIAADLREIEAKVSKLRARRREISARLHPESTVKAALVSVPTAAEVEAAQTKLGKARDCAGASANALGHGRPVWPD